MLSQMITVIKSSFVQHKLTILRNKKTSNTVFRQTMNETSYLIAADVLKYLPYKKTKIQTPLKYTNGTVLAKQIILVPILRAGLGLLEGFSKFLPDSTLTFNRWSLKLVNSILTQFPLCPPFELM